MRYTIVSLESTDGQNWVDPQVVSMRDRVATIRVATGLPIPCYVVDCFDNSVIYRRGYYL